MNTNNANGHSPVIRIIRWVATIVVVAGVLEGLLQTNVQKLAEQEGWDKLLADNWHPIMDKVSAITTGQIGWNVFWFFAGVAAALWLVRMFPAKSFGSGNIAQADQKPNVDLANALSTDNMNVIVDKRKKIVQVGFNLKNTADVPVRFTVKNMSVVIDGKTVMNPSFVGGSIVVPKNSIKTYFFPAINCVIGNKDASATASIEYTYGPAGADEPPVREANHSVSLSISPSAFHYTTLEENDGPI